MPTAQSFSGGVFGRAKRALFGRPLATDRLEHERLSKTTGLAVLSSDAISSVAYATDQILISLSVLGAPRRSGTSCPYQPPSSRSWCSSACRISRRSGHIREAADRTRWPGRILEPSAGLIAAASLLTDYVLTVSVSVAGGVAAITSAYPSLAGHTVSLCIGCVALLMIGNLRGVRESGIAFSVPTTCSSP
jgi:hypothetical protein